MVVQIRRLCCIAVLAALLAAPAWGQDEDVKPEDDEYADEDKGAFDCPQVCCWFRHSGRRQHDCYCRSLQCRNQASRLTTPPPLPRVRLSPSDFGASCSHLLQAQLWLSSVLSDVQLSL